MILEPYIVILATITLTALTIAVGTLTFLHYQLSKRVTENYKTLLQRMLELGNIVYQQHQFIHDVEHECHCCDCDDMQETDEAPERVLCPKCLKESHPLIIKIDGMCTDCLDKYKESINKEDSKESTKN